jgi:hypothetical protein
MKNKSLVVIITFDREEGFWNLYNSIDIDLVDVCVVQGGSYTHPYSTDFNPNELDIDFLFRHEEKLPVVFLKQEGFNCAKDNGYDHVFIVEDDVVIEDNGIWQRFIEFSEHSGIKHSNWNSAAKNQQLFEYKINNSMTGVVHKHAQGCFQHFTSDLFDVVKWDENYVNAFEHGDVEYDLSLKGHIAPFWTFASPSGLDDMLSYDDGGESTITGKDGYEDNVKLSLDHWKSKWGVKPNEIKPASISVITRYIMLKQKRHGIPMVVKEIVKTKPDPVSIVVTIKDRCVIKYRNNDDLLPKELNMMVKHDAVIGLMSKTNDGRGGIMTNKRYMESPSGFRPFDKFLKSINEQAHRFEGDVELIVTDWGSTDDNVRDVVESIWQHDFTIIDLPADEKFSRGHGLNESIKLTKYDKLHITDVDMTYKTPRFLEDASSLNKNAIFPIIAKEQTPSGLTLYMECAGFGIASIEKSVFNEAGGFDDIRKWGGEDANLFTAVDKILGRDNVKRPMYNDAIHTWHSDLHRGS